MKTFIFTLILTLFLTQTAYSQFLPSQTGANVQIGRPYEILSFNKQTAYISSGYGTLLSRNGGENFETFILDFIPKRIHFFNDSVYLALLAREFKVTQNSGKTWESKKLVLSNGDTVQHQNLNFQDFKIFANERGFVTNYQDSIKPEVYYTKNNGLTWQLLDSTMCNLNIYNTRTVSNYKQFVFDSTLFVKRFGLDTILIKYSNYGQKAEEINLAKKIPESISSVQITFKDELNGLFRVSTKDFKTKFYQTTDGAVTFTEVATNTTGIFSIFYAKASENKAAFYLGLTKDYTVFSRDDGKTWYQNFDETILSPYIDFYDAETGVALQSVSIFDYKPFYFRGLQTVGVKNISDNKISVYPNPVNTVLNIENLKDAFAYKVINVAGKVILEGTKEAATNHQINTESLENGVYVLNIITNEGLITKKLIKAD